MRKMLLVIILFSMITVIYGKENGLTIKKLTVPSADIEYTVTSGTPNLTESQTVKKKEILNRDEWAVVDSIFLDMYVAAGEFQSVYFDNSDATLHCETSQPTLIPESEQAIRKAPSWLRVDLKNTLSQLDDTNQLKWASVINNAVDPYIDEIAFSIAHISVEFLSSPYAYTEIFTENAYLIYEFDNDLDYVDVVDYGMSFSDDDYYSTTSYWKTDTTGNLSEVEVPKDIYYWYIVHPKITDEIPAFIDPEVIESNVTHSNNITGPDEGYFWRNYLYNHNDEGYPKLKYYLQNCDVVWNGTNLSLDTAVGAIKKWITQSMSFTSDAERPHQPVRIYAKHIGRCGEYSDITSAATRIALIPSTGILSISGDHTWNEFWDEEWISWEPVNGYINNPLVYENSWGKVFGSVFEIRSDGLLTPVTDRYSAGFAELNVYVVDTNGNPVDGARILLGTSINSTPVGDNIGFTDNEGKYTFIIGDERDYFASISSALGNTAYTQLVDDAEPGQIYNSTITLSGEMPSLNFTGIAVPDDPTDDWKLQYDFNYENQVIHGAIPFDDIDDSYFNQRQTSGLGNFFLCSQSDFTDYSNGNLFSAFLQQIDVDAGNGEFNIPADQNWYAVFDNSNNLNNPQHLTGWFILFNYDQSAGSGVLSGNVFDPANGIPIAGATVTAGVFQTTTDADGNFSLNEVYPNIYNVTCEADGFFDYIENGVQVTNGGTTQVDIEMQELTLAPTDVVAEVLDNGNSLIVWNSPYFIRENIKKRPNSKSNRELTGFDIYVFSRGDELNVSNWSQVAYNIPGNSYEDFVWTVLDEGIYRYAVCAVYSDGIQSAPALSNELYKDLHVPVEVMAFTNCGDSADGAIVNLKNQECPNSIFDYSEIVENGIAQFDQVLKGTYTLTISKPFYEDYVLTDIEITEATFLQGLLTEIIYNVQGVGVIDYTAIWDAVPVDETNRSFQYYNIYVDDLTTPVTNSNDNSFDLSPYGSGIHEVGISAVFSSGESAISSLQYEDGMSLLTDIVAYFALDGDALDSSGNGNNGIINGDITFPEGISGLCAEFDAEAENIVASSIFTNAPQAFTVAWWLLPNSTSNYNQQVRAAIGWDGFNFHTTNEGKIFTGTNVGTRFVPASCSEGVLTDEWQFFAFSFDNGSASLFRNGNLIAQKENMAMPLAWDGFQIGTSNTNTIDGKVDEVRVWERFVGEAEIQYLFTENYPAWGTIEGTVTSVLSGDPVEGATISAGMFETSTDINGYYSMDVAACTYYSVECLVDDYDVENVENITIGENETVIIDFEYGFTGTSNENSVPKLTKLYDNYPNPFNPATTISFDLDQSNFIQLSVFNVKGQLVKQLINSTLDAGNYNITWNGKDENNRSVASGIYFYRLKSGNEIYTKKMILLK